MIDAARAQCKIHACDSGAICLNLREDPGNEVAFALKNDCCGEEKSLRHDASGSKISGPQETVVLQI